SYSASLDPAEIDVEDGWWQISGEISVNNGANFMGSIGIYRRSHYDGTVEYYVDEFELGLWDNAFQFKFRDVYVNGDTIYAGRIYMKVNSSLIPSTSFIDGGYFSIDARSLAIYHGELIDLDFAITFPDFVFPAGGHTVGIRRAKMRLVWEDGEITRFSGGGRFEISGLMPDMGSDTYIGAYVTIIRDAGLDDVRLEFMGWSPGVPLGASGFFLTGVEGEVRHITDPENIYIEFGCQLSGGPSVPYFGSVVRMEPRVWVDFGHDEFALEGAIRFLEHLARGEAGLRYQWNYGGGGWALTGYANLRTGITDHIWARGGTDLSLWREHSGDFHFTGDAGVEVHIDHHAIAWLFPTHDIEVDGDLYFGEFRHGGDSGGHWGVKGEAYLNFFGLRPSIAYIDGHTSLMEEARSYTPVDMLRTFYCKSSLVSEDLNYEIGDDDMKLFILRTAEDVRPAFSVETPEGHTITLDSCSYDESADLVKFDGYYDGYYYQGMMIKRASSGVWVAHISDLPAGDTDHLVQVKSFRNAMNIGLSTTTMSSGFAVSGEVDGTRPGDTVYLTIMLKPRDIIAGAMPIEKNILTDDFSFDRTFNFDELGFKEGEYYILAYAEDQHNRFASFVDSVNVISIPEDDVPPSAPSGVLACWVDDENIRITWDYNTEADVVGYKIYKGWQDGSSIDWWETIDVADVNYYCFDNAKVMIPDTLDFVFGVSAYDNAGNESEIAVVVPSGADSSERDTIPPSVEITALVPNLADKILTVEWSGDADVYSYILTVGPAPGEITYRRQLSGDVDEYAFHNLIVGSDYYVSVIAVDSALNFSVPDSEVVAFYDVADNDGDGIPDWWEEFFFDDVDSCVPDDDPDGDLVNNRNEYLSGTNPNSQDSDGDGVPDLAEIASPDLDPNSDADNDGDRLPDDWEIYFFGSDSIRNLANTDNDEDGLTNIEEYQHGTDPHNYDTDGGGLSDGDEVMLESDPKDPADDNYISYTIHIEDGWNLISLPVQPYSTNWRELFPTAIAAYGYDPTVSSYFSVSEMEVGRGYWILSIGEMDVNLTGVPVLSYTISCSAGWNLVASPLFPSGFPTGSIATSPDGILMTPLYFFDGEFYSVATQLQPGEGYWAFLTEDGSFVIDRSYAGFERNYSSDGCEMMTNPPAPPSAEMVSVPKKLTLFAAPNPFNSSTEITVQMPKDGAVSLKVYDSSGKFVKDLFTGQLSAGVHSFEWDATTQNGVPAATGLYILRIDTDSEANVIKVLLVR
ncbi:T9SS type A sorting domain-containing protein, partial [bacterium]|nr:T9SS type A sorting domain-containing protein [bacterium]